MCGCSCGSCLDPLVLPIGPTGATGSQGLTGATGAQGDPGEAGSSTIVLYNDETRSTNTSGTLALFTATKAYSISAGTLSTDDVIELTIIFSTTSFVPFNDLGFDVFFNGGSFTSVVAPLNFYTVASDLQLYAKLKLEISVVDDTTLLINAASYLGDEDGYTLSHHHWTNRAFTVASLAANALAIDVRGKTSVGTLNCDHLLVKHFQI